MTKPISRHAASAFVLLALGACASKDEGRTAEWPPKFETSRKDYETDPKDGLEFPHFERQYDGEKLVWEAEHFAPEALLDMPKLYAAAVAAATKYFGTEKIVDSEIVYEGGTAKFEVTVETDEGLRYEVMLDGLAEGSSPVVFEQQITSDLGEYGKVIEAVKDVLDGATPGLIGWIYDEERIPFVEKLWAKSAASASAPPTYGGWTPPAGFVADGFHAKVWTTSGLRCKVVLAYDSAGTPVAKKIFTETDDGDDETEFRVWG